MSGATTDVMMIVLTADDESGNDKVVPAESVQREGKVDEHYVELPDRLL